VRAALPLALLAGIGPVACDHRAPLDVQKENLAVLPLVWRRPSIHVAEDGAHVTYTVRVGDGYQVVTPRGLGDVYPEVSPPLFAPGSTRVFYWAASDRDGKRVFDVVADGVAVATPFVETTDLVHARGGTRWATLGVVDAPAGLPRMAIVVDGAETGRWHEASTPAFSPDGAHVAWIVRDRDGRVTVLVDGKPVRTTEATPPADDGPRFDRLASVRFLADGRLLTLAPEGVGWAIHRGEERLASYGQNLIPSGTLLLAGPDTTASVVAPSIVTAARAPVAVWWERMPGAAERWRVVRDGAAVDGLVCDRWWGSQLPVVSDDGLHVAYVCPTPTEPEVPLGRRWIVLDGRRFGSYVEAWTLGVSADGAQVAYGAADSLPIVTWRVYANGSPRTATHELVWRPRFSPDGRHVFWAAGPERGRRTIGVDARRVTRFDDVLYGPEFPAPDTPVWVIRRGRKISRIVARLPG
jgi:hypothetical protein